MNWEIKWVQNNSHLYDSELHSRAVIENIKKRYKLKEALTIFNQLMKDITNLG